MPEKRPSVSNLWTGGPVLFYTEGEETGEGEAPLDIEFKLDPAQERPKVTITAAALTDEVNDLLRRLEAGQPAAITAFQDERVVLLSPERILRFFADGKGVSAQSDQGVYGVRERLYELEGLLDRHTFVRISHSEIVNLRKITALDLSLTGTIRVTLDGGTVCYVSRRYVRKIKEALGL